MSTAPTPTVTVVIPAYNAAATLPETLASLLSQTFEDFEAIVVDDGSTDATASVAVASGDQRIRVVTVPNGGVARARNHAIGEAQGEFVAFLDADDLWEPRKLERQVDAMREQPGAGFCVTGAIRIDAASRPLGPIPITTPTDACRTLLLHTMAVGHLSAGMARTDLLQELGGFDPRFSQCADWDLWLRMGAATKFVVIEEPLMRYRTSPGNMSSNPELLERDTFAVLDAFYASGIAAPYMDIRSAAYGRYWMMCSGTYLHRSRPADAVRCLLAGVRAHPASIARALTMPLRWARRLSAGTSPQP